MFEISVMICGIPHQAARAFTNRESAEFDILKFELIHFLIYAKFVPSTISIVQECGPVSIICKRFRSNKDLKDTRVVHYYQSNDNLTMKVSWNYQFK